MINKNLLLVTMLSVGTALTTLGKAKPVAASLTPPTSYDYSYTWNATASEQYLNVNGVDSIPLYTRTADGAYWNYTTNFNVIDGLNVEMTFNRSNTQWQVSGTNYKPDENRIGSDNTVGNVQKYLFHFDNQTSNDYLLYMDVSSTASIHNIDYVFNSTYPVYGNGYAIIQSITLQNNYYIPAYTSIKINAQFNSNQRYFDAWFLKDLGVSEAWQQGYDADTQGILTDYLGTDAQQIGWVLLGIAAILFVFKGGK